MFYFYPVTLANPMTTAKSVHRIFVIDCSGSMSDSLSHLCTHLKNKIPHVTRSEDYISVVWFRHEGSAGCIQEHVSVGNLEELQALNNALDRFLYASGGTSFSSPMTIANKLASKYSEPSQIFFMTDGVENNKSSVTRFQFASTNSSVVLVEYGWYTDSPYMQELTNASNGTHVFSRDFEKITETFDTYLQNPVTERQVVPVRSPTDCFCVLNNELKIFSSVNGVCKVLYHPDMKRVYTFDESSVGSDAVPVALDNSTEICYAYLWFGCKQKNEDLIVKVLKMLGDVYYIKKYNSCFSKQDWEDLIAEIRCSYLNPSQRFKNGLNRNFAPNDACFTVVDLLKLLQEDSTARFYPYHPKFTYERISKAVVASNQDEVVIDKTKGAEVSLVYHASRANISLNCTLQATSNGKATKVYRNYAVVKDGVKHVATLPLSFSEATFTVLRNNEILSSNETYSPEYIYLVPLAQIPVVNRQMLSSGSFNLTAFCQAHVDLLRLKAVLKYLNARLKALDPPTKKQDDDDEDSGERPLKKAKMDSGSVADSYVAKELVVKVAKCSSLPAINDKLFDKLDGNRGKLTVTEEFMYWIHELYVSTESRCNGNVTEMIKEVRSLIERIKSLSHSKSMYLEGIKFAILAGGRWFSESNNGVYDGPVKHSVTLPTVGERAYGCTVEIVNTVVVL